MKDALNNVNGWVTGLVTLFKSVIVFFVFAGILFPPSDQNPNYVDAIGGIITLIKQFTAGGLAGLLALVVFASFSK